MNISVKTVASVSERERRRVPPCMRMIWRERLRPMPLPSGLVVKNGMKISSWLAALIGGPSLLTLMTALSRLSSSAEISMCLAPAYAAFFTRLIRIWEIWLSSAYSSTSSVFSTKQAVAPAAVRTGWLRSITLAAMSLAKNALRTGTAT